MKSYHSEPSLRPVAPCATLIRASRRAKSEARAASVLAPRSARLHDRLTLSGVSITPLSERSFARRVGSMLRR
jgi:hypothetical protein